MMIRLSSQPQTGGATFETGADVSRFARRTVPGKAKGDSSPNSGGFGPQPAGANPGPAPVTGPVVRVARGNAITVVPVGGKN